MSLLGATVSAVPQLWCSFAAGVGPSAGLELQVVSGNYSVPLRLVSLDLDLQPPVLSVVSGPASVTGATVARFAVSCSDASTCAMTYTVNGFSLAEVCVTDSFAPCMFELSGLLQGQHSLTLLGLDSAGNKATNLT